ncbi:unnamed protein product [Amoebophrya sp. A120]|nr:unnamed protein product [Amoebophrya sp. A120]|eukprot:GSA120T00020066001.1
MMMEQPPPPSSMLLDRSLLREAERLLSLVAEDEILRFEEVGIEARLKYHIHEQQTTSHGVLLGAASGSRAASGTPALPENVYDETGGSSGSGFADVGTAVQHDNFPEHDTTSGTNGNHVDQSYNGAAPHFRTQSAPTHVAVDGSFYHQSVAAHNSSSKGGSFIPAAQRAEGSAMLANYQYGGSSPSGGAAGMKPHHFPRGHGRKMRKAAERVEEEVGGHEAAAQQGIHNYQHQVEGPAGVHQHSGDGYHEVGHPGVALIYGGGPPGPRKGGKPMKSGGGPPHGGVGTTAKGQLEGQVGSGGPPGSAHLVQHKNNFESTTSSRPHAGTWAAPEPTPTHGKNQISSQPMAIQPPAPTHVFTSSAPGAPTQMSHVKGMNMKSKKGGNKQLDYYSPAHGFYPAPPQLMEQQHFYNAVQVGGKMLKGGSTGGGFFHPSSKSGAPGGKNQQPPAPFGGDNLWGPAGTAAAFSPKGGSWGAGVGGGQHQKSFWAWHPQKGGNNSGAAFSPHYQHAPPSGGGPAGYHAFPWNKNGQQNYNSYHSKNNGTGAGAPSKWDSWAGHRSYNHHQQGAATAISSSSPHYNSWNADPPGSSSYYNAGWYTSGHGSFPSSAGHSETSTQNANNDPNYNFMRPGTTATPWAGGADNNYENKKYFAQENAFENYLQREQVANSNWDHEHFDPTVAWTSPVAPHPRGRTASNITWHPGWSEHYKQGWSSPANNNTGEAKRNNSSGGGSKSNVAVSSSTTASNKQDNAFLDGSSHAGPARSNIFTQQRSTTSGHKQAQAGGGAGNKMKYVDNFSSSSTTFYGASTAASSNRMNHNQVELNLDIMESPDKEDDEDDLYHDGVVDSHSPSPSAAKVDVYSPTVPGRRGGPDTSNYNRKNRRGGFEERTLIFPSQSSAPPPTNDYHQSSTAKSGGKKSKGHDRNRSNHRGSGNFQPDQQEEHGGPAVLAQVDPPAEDGATAGDLFFGKMKDDATTEPNANGSSLSNKNKRLEFISYDAERRCFYYKINYDIPSEIDRLDDLLAKTGPGTRSGAVNISQDLLFTDAPGPSPLQQGSASPLSTDAASSTAALPVQVQKKSTSSTRREAEQHQSQQRRRRTNTNNSKSTTTTSSTADLPVDNNSWELLQRKKHLVRYLRTTTGTLGSFGVSGNGVFEICLYSELPAERGQDVETGTTTRSRATGRHQLEAQDDKNFLKNDHDDQEGSSETFGTAAEINDDPSEEDSSCASDHLLEGNKTSSAPVTGTSSSSSSSSSAEGEDPRLGSAPDDHGQVAAAAAAVKAAEKRLKDLKKRIAAGRGASTEVDDDDPGDEVEGGDDNKDDDQHHADAPPNVDIKGQHAVKKRRKKSRSTSRQQHTTTVVKLLSFNSEICTKNDTFPLFRQAAFVSVSLLAAFPQPLVVDSWLWRDLELCSRRGNKHDVEKTLAAFLAHAENVKRICSCGVLGGDGVGARWLSKNLSADEKHHTMDRDFVNKDVDEAENVGWDAGAATQEQSNKQLLLQEKLATALAELEDKQAASRDRQKAGTTTPGPTTALSVDYAPLPSIGGNRATWHLWLRPDYFNYHATKDHVEQTASSSSARGRGARGSSGAPATNNYASSTTTLVNRTQIQLTSEKFYLEGVPGPLQILFYPHGEPRGTSCTTSGFHTSSVASTKPSTSTATRKSRVSSALAAAAASTGGDGNGGHHNGNKNHSSSTRSNPRGGANVVPVKSASPPAQDVPTPSPATSSYLSGLVSPGHTPTIRKIRKKIPSPSPPPGSPPVVGGGGRVVGGPMKKLWADGDMPEAERENTAAAEVEGTSVGMTGRPGREDEKSPSSDRKSRSGQPPEDDSTEERPDTKLKDRRSPDKDHNNIKTALKGSKSSPTKTATSSSSSSSSGPSSSSSSSDTVEQQNKKPIATPTPSAFDTSSGTTGRSKAAVGIGVLNKNKKKAKKHAAGSSGGAKGSSNHLRKTKSETPATSSKSREEQQQAELKLKTLTSCALFLKAPSGTRHAFCMRVGNTQRCAAHYWDRDSNWGFPTFSHMLGNGGALTVQVEALAEVPPVAVTGRVADWCLDSSLFSKIYFQPGEEIRSEPFKVGDYELQLFLYPHGSGTDPEYVSLFLKYSGKATLTCHVSLDGIGPRGLCHDGNGIWGYPTFCPRSFLANYFFLEKENMEATKAACWDLLNADQHTSEDDVAAMKNNPPTEEPEEEKQGDNADEVFIAGNIDVVSPSSTVSASKRKRRKMESQSVQPQPGNKSCDFAENSNTSNANNDGEVELPRASIKTQTLAGRSADKNDRKLQDFGLRLVAEQDRFSKTKSGPMHDSRSIQESGDVVSEEPFVADKPQQLLEKIKIPRAEIFQKGEHRFLPQRLQRAHAPRVQNPCTRKLSHSIKIRLEIITSSDRTAFREEEEPEPGPESDTDCRLEAGEANFNNNTPVAVQDERQQINRPAPAKIASPPVLSLLDRNTSTTSSSSKELPTLLHISCTLSEICGLPPPRVVKSRRSMLWLGGDGASASRFLLAYYLNQLDCNLLFTAPVEDGSTTMSAAFVSQNLPKDPEFDVLAVTTGDDELLYLQDMHAARPDFNHDRCVRNDPGTTSYRQHKFLQRLRCEHGDFERYCRRSQTGTADFQMVPLHEDTIKASIQSYPVVLKIPYSDSSCGVVVVQSESELADCIRTTLGPANVWDVQKLPAEPFALGGAEVVEGGGMVQHHGGQVAHSDTADLDEDEYATRMRYAYNVPRLVIIEPLLVGDEYVVNLVSCEGVHVVSDAWVSTVKKVDEETKRPLYDEQELCAELPLDVLNFCREALDRCGLVFGASHLELIRCQNTKQVRLIELNARLAGDFPRAQSFFKFHLVPNGPAATTPKGQKTNRSTSLGKNFLRQYGVNQFSLLALATACPSDFLAFAKLNQEPLKVIDPSMTVRAVFLLANVDGKFRGKGLERLCKLKTFCGLRRALGHLPVPAAIHPLRMILHCSEQLELMSNYSEGNKEKERVENNISCEREHEDEKSGLDDNFLQFPALLGSTKKTMSLRSCPGVLLLAGDRAQVQADTDRIRETELGDELYHATGGPPTRVDFAV